MGQKIGYFLELKKEIFETGYKFFNICFRDAEEVTPDVVMGPFSVSKPSKVSIFQYITYKKIPVLHILMIVFIENFGNYSRHQCCRGPYIFENKIK